MDRFMAKWIGEYEQLTNMQTAGSGSARWCIARRYEQRFFIKEFLTPVYPPKGRLTALARDQRKRCEVFEGRKQRLYSALSCVIGDTLVPVVDFFRYNGRYYSVSEEVPQPYMMGESISSISTRETRALIYELAECLLRLHSQGIVHADLKPEHLLLAGRAGAYRLRLIDLDSGFLMDEPPSAKEEIEGDPVFLAPEAFLRLMGEKTILNGKVDTFALGILIHWLWTKTFPWMDTRRYTYLYEAALANGEIRISPEVPFSYRVPIQQMLRRDPTERPDDREIMRLLSFSQNEITRIPRIHHQLNGLSRFMKKPNGPFAEKP